jgi:hypothetical protein
MNETNWTVMTYTGGMWSMRSVPLRALSAAVFVLGSSLFPGATQANATVAEEEICMPHGTYPTTAGAMIVFSHDKTCFSRPVTHTFPWEKKLSRVTKRTQDRFNGARVVRYDYHDALYHCAKRHMRLPSVEELTALFVYENKGDNSAPGSQYAIVAPKDDLRYPGGLHGWGGSSTYWSHTFAGKGFHNAINLENGRVSINHDSQHSYVSCVH